MTPSNKSQFDRTVIEHHLIGHPMIHDNRDKGSFRPKETLKPIRLSARMVLYCTQKL